VLFVIVVFSDWNLPINYIGTLFCLSSCPTHVQKSR